MVVGIVMLAALVALDSAAVSPSNRAYEKYTRQKLLNSVCSLVAPLFAVAENLRNCVFKFFGAAARLRIGRLAV